MPSPSRRDDEERDMFCTDKCELQIARLQTKLDCRDPSADLPSAPRGLAAARPPGRCHEINDAIFATDSITITSPRFHFEVSRNSKRNREITASSLRLRRNIALFWEQTTGSLSVF